MSLTYGFYNSLNHDRLYTATQMSRIFDGIIKDGVFQSIGTAMMVTPNSGMTVNIGIGRAWFDHTWTDNDAIYPITVEQPSTVLDRIDAVILKTDATTDKRKNTFEIVKGVESSQPARPVLVDTEYVHHHVLAYIDVKANITNITVSEITNMVGTAATPFITGILETVSTSDLIVQWKSQWNDQIEENQSEFEQWFSDRRSDYNKLFEDSDQQLDANQIAFEKWLQDLKDELDANQAANLQKQIDEVRYEDLLGRCEMVNKTTSELIIDGVQAIKEIASDKSYMKITKFNLDGSISEQYVDEDYILTKTTIFREKETIESFEKLYNNGTIVIE